VHDDHDRPAHRAQQDYHARPARNRRIDVSGLLV
jgi:hypothetical protein